MSTDRFNKAARDGYLDALKEATRKDLNQKDEDGMTPTLWASFEGNLDALRLIVSRGGDPDKCDNFGNTALHFAAARGHLHCVTFLVNFGVNMWALDIDYHTPKDLAAINNKEEILRFLDAAIAKEEAKDKKKLCNKCTDGRMIQLADVDEFKSCYEREQDLRLYVIRIQTAKNNPYELEQINIKVKSYKEKAAKEAEKRVKEFDKLQKKASKSAEEEQRKLMKKREKMEKSGGMTATPHIITGIGIPNESSHQTVPQQQPAPTHSALSFLSLRKDTRPIRSGNSGSHSFSELTSSTHSSAKLKSTGFHTGVHKKVQQRKTLNSAKATGSDFKVGDVTDGGKRSVRSLSGLRRDNEVMYVPKYEITSVNNVGKRGKISGLFENDTEESDGLTPLGRRYSTRSGGSEPEDEIDDENPSRLTRSFSQPDYIHQAGVQTTSGYNEEPMTRGHTNVSIFERPGFGSVAFRKNMNSTLNNFASFTTHQHQHNSNHRNGNGHGHGGMDSVLFEEEDDNDDDNDLHRDSIGSASSLDGRFKTQLGNSGSAYNDGDHGPDEELGNLEVFLAAAHLMDYAHVFVKEKIDLEALLLLTDEDFKSMGIELGPRRKLLNAITDRQRVMENPGEVIDSHL